MQWVLVVMAAVAVMGCGGDGSDGYWRWWLVVAAADRGGGGGGYIWLRGILVAVNGLGRSGQ
jgi:hypothetical protein